MIFPLLSLRERVLCLIFVLFLPVLESSAQNLILNGGFEADAAAIAGATGDGSASSMDSNIDFWSVDVRGSGDYSFLSTIGTFQGGGGGNLVAGVDLASFQLAGGAPAGYGGSTHHIDFIGAAIGEVNHYQQRLNSVLNQSITGLDIGSEYELTFHYSTTNYAAQPREIRVRIDPEISGVIDHANTLYNAPVTVGFAPGDPAGIITSSDLEEFGSMTGPDPMDYSTIPPVDPFDLDLTLRTVASNALSVTTTFDEVAGSAEAPVIVNWQTTTVKFVPLTADIRLSFYNTTDTFSQDESDYHYRTMADGMGKHDIWFGHEVGLLLDDVSIIQIPEPGTFMLLAATTLFFLIRRSARKYSEARPPAAAKSRAIDRSPMTRPISTPPPDPRSLTSDANANSATSSRT